jgi:hypothetical protein
MQVRLVHVLVAAALTAIALISAGAVQGKPRAGSAEEIVLNDLRVCMDGGRFLVADTEQRPLRIVIRRKSGSRLARKSFTLTEDRYTFDPSLDPRGTGSRDFSNKFKFRWPRRLEPGTSLVVKIFGHPDANPETFPDPSDPSEPRIAVAKCRLFNEDD